MRLLSELIKRLAVAECVQWQNRKRPLTLGHWQYLAREDTGSMFEICAALGARSHRLRRFGRLLGMLYHGCDDVADLRGSADLGGGGVEDLNEGILTLPAALAIESDDRICKIFCQNSRTEDELIRLRIAFEAQLEAAEAELDRLEREAIEEAERANLRAPEYLIALVTDTRKLSSR
jgi:geranylgeranyl pyrophosphate synthase